MLTPLNPARAYKPLDFGNGLLAGSVSAAGRWLALNTYHPTHGYLTLTDMPPFSETQRYQQAAVRAYRAQMADAARRGFGWTFDGQWSQRAYLLADAIPQCVLENAQARITLTTFAPEGACTAIQHCEVTNKTDGRLSLGCCWGGQLSLQRAPYPQLTEGGPLAMPSTLTQLEFDGEALHISNGALDWRAHIAGLPFTRAWQRRSDAPVALSLTHRIMLEPRGSRALDVTIQLCDALPARRASLAESEQAWQARWTRAQLTRDDDWHLRRALAYILSCCALPNHDGYCLLTDHQLLPLSWNRDGYFVASALLAVGARDERLLRIVRGHLHWLFQVAERPHGYWARAYLANGRVKDAAFQLDQQCYPFLELCDYVRASGDDNLVAACAAQVPAWLEMLMRWRADGAQLFATSETPADDPLPLPYHFSSHVLLWHTLRSLAALDARETAAAHDLAAQVREDTLRWFTRERNGQPLFAYATNLQGETRFYHDANDMPTVLAPVWGFCTAADEAWRNTLAFAWSTDNHGGYYAGPYGGLGSLHTPHAWSLGDVQEWLCARLLHDDERAARVADTLRARATWDGLWPEASDEQTNAVASRHWFAWPAAAWLWLQILERQLHAN